MEMLLLEVSALWMSEGNKVDALNRIDGRRPYFVLPRPRQHFGDVLLPQLGLTGKLILLLPFVCFRLTI